MKQQRILGIPKSTDCGIYMLMNISNHRVYIGETHNFKQRAQTHLGQLRSKKHSNEQLQSDFDDGCDFIFTILENMGSYCETEKRTMRERLYIYSFRDRGVKLYNQDTREHLEKRLFMDMISPSVREIQRNFRKKYRIPLAAIWMCKVNALKERFVAADPLEKSA